MALPACGFALAAAVAQRQRGGKVASPWSPTRAPITALFLYNDQSVGVLLQSHGHALFFLVSLYEYYIHRPHDARYTQEVS